MDPKDMGTRGTGTRQTGGWGCGVLAWHRAVPPAPSHQQDAHSPGGHSREPRGHGSALGARPHTRVFATRGWARTRTHVCVRRAARASPGVIFTQPRWHRCPQPSRSSPCQGDGERNELGNGLAASSMARHGHPSPTAWSFLPHSVVIPAPWHRHPCPTTRQFCPKDKQSSSSPRAVPCRAIRCRQPLPCPPWPPVPVACSFPVSPPPPSPPRPQPHRWAQRCPLCAGWVLGAWGDRGRLVVRRRRPPGPAASMRPLFCAGPWWPQEHCCGGGLAPAGGRGQCQPGVCPPPRCPHAPGLPPYSYLQSPCNGTPTPSLSLLSPCTRTPPIFLSPCMGHPPHSHPIVPMHQDTPHP